MLTLTSGEGLNSYIALSAIEVLAQSHDDNNSNGGVEGEPSDVVVIKKRQRRRTMTRVPERCPACGAAREAIAPIEGCAVCQSCGWSPCSG